MKFPLVLLVFGTCSFTLLGADKCDCTHFPIRPQACSSVCAANRLNAAADVLTSVVGAPDRGIPQELLSRAECVIIVPGIENARFIVGAQYGQGFTVCRRENGAGWAAPAAIRIEGGSFGFQFGGSQTDLIMLVMSKRGADKLLSSRFTLGAEVSVAAGPVGRTATAQPDAQMHAEILVWSRSQGLFAEVSINGATLRPDDQVNQELYGRAVSNGEILTGEVKPTASASRLQGVLNRDFIR